MIRGFEKPGLAQEIQQAVVDADRIWAFESPAGGIQEKCRGFSCIR
ncbi:MAG: hypothetical protein ACLSCU_02985 [Eubacterium sp.]